MADYINRDALLQEIEQERRASKNSFPRQYFVVGDVLTCIRTAPAADVVEVVRCGECRHAEDSLVLWCTEHEQAVSRLDFCSRGARMDKEDEHD